MENGNGRFTAGYYFGTLTRVLGQPKTFFRQLPAETGFVQPAGFLMVSSAFFTGACLLTQSFDRPLLTGGIFFVNAVGMTFIAAALGYLSMSMIAGRKADFARIFSVYAFSTGITLLATWIPLFIWLTEPWKWILIGSGLTISCGLKWTQSLMVIGMSIGIMILFFSALLPLIV